MVDNFLLKKSNILLYIISMICFLMVILTGFRYFTSGNFINIAFSSIFCGLVAMIFNYIRTRPIEIIVSKEGLYATFRNQEEKINAKWSDLEKINYTRIGPYIGITIIYKNKQWKDLGLYRKNDVQIFKEKANIE